MQRCQEGAAIAREQHVDFILAVGGGSVIDCCKVISAQALLDEDIWEMEYGKGQFPNAGIPVGGGCHRIRHRGRNERGRRHHP